MQNNKNQMFIKSLRNKFSTNTKFSEAFQIEESVLQGATEYYELKEIDNELPNLFESLANLNQAFNSSTTFTNTFPINSNQNNSYSVKKNITAQQMRILCEIDILMLKYYYLIRQEVFKQHNQKQLRTQNGCNDRILWIKKRFQHHYHDKIAFMLCKLVDQVQQNQAQEFQIDSIIDIQFIPKEIIELDLKLKQQTIEPLEYSDPYQVYQEIINLIKLYLN